MDYILFHGTKAHPGINWFPWLKGKLEATGHRVHIPALPTPEGQTCGNWLKEMKQQVPALHQDTVVIGHSTGAAFIPHVLRELDTSIRMAVLVSPFHKMIDITEYDELNETFFFDDFDVWPQRAKTLAVVHGDNDPYVPLEQAEFISRGAGAALTVVAGGGHLNSEFGFETFDTLWNILHAEGVA